MANVQLKVQEKVELKVQSKQQMTEANRNIFWETPSPLSKIDKSRDLV